MQSQLEKEKVFMGVMYLRRDGTSLVFTLNPTTRVLIFQKILTHTHRENTEPRVTLPCANRCQNLPRNPKRPKASSP